MRRTACFCFAASVSIAALTAVEAVRVDEAEEQVSVVAISTSNNSTDDNDTNSTGGGYISTTTGPKVAGSEEITLSKYQKCVGSFVTSCSEITQRETARLYNRGCSRFFEMQRDEQNNMIYWQCMKNDIRVGQRSTMANAEVYSERLPHNYAGSEALAEEGCKSTKSNSMSRTASDTFAHPCISDQV